MLAGKEVIKVEKCQFAPTKIKKTFVWNLQVLKHFLQSQTLWHVTLKWMNYTCRRRTRIIMRKTGAKWTHYVHLEEFMILSIYSTMSPRITENWNNSFLRWFLSNLSLNWLNKMLRARNFFTNQSFQIVILDIFHKSVISDCYIGYISQITFRHW